MRLTAKKNSVPSKQGNKPSATKQRWKRNENDNQFKETQHQFKELQKRLTERKLHSENDRTIQTWKVWQKSSWTVVKKYLKWTTSHETYSSTGNA